MQRGIILFGAMAVGDSTIGRAVAKELNCVHIDLDDYSWRWDTPMPYTVFRSRQERIESIMGAVDGHEEFVMSGSMWSIRKSFEPLFCLGVFLTAPVDVRARRLEARERMRWGNRVLPGGDMYEARERYRDYVAWAAQYDRDIRPNMCIVQHEQWVRELPCPVLRLDATRPAEESVQRIVSEYRRISSEITPEK